MIRHVATTVRSLSRIARDPRTLSRVLDDEETSREQVERRHNRTQGLPVIGFEDVLPSGRETITPYAFLEGGSLVTDHALLRGLARQFPKCRYFEIGTWRGESVANVASVAAECFTLSLPDDDMRRMGCSEAFIAEHRKYSGHLPNVTHLRADSRHFDYAGAGKFDLVFIDGDHHYPTVASDTANVFRHLLHENSVVVWHDYAFSPEEVRWEVLRGILDGVPPELHAHLYHVSHTMSAVFTRRRFPTRTLRSPETPDLDFKIEVSWQRP
jgi:predicted O-methyltransferase YrrM